MKRLIKEIDRLIDAPPDDVTRVKVTDDGTERPVLYAIRCNADAFKGDWPVRITFPADYPYSPPHCTFLEPIPFHPNIDFRNGGVCADILLSTSCWSPTYGVERLLLGLISLLDGPNTDHGLNNDAIQLLKQDPAAFIQRALAEGERQRAKPTPAYASSSEKENWENWKNKRKQETPRQDNTRDGFEQERQAAVGAVPPHAEEHALAPSWTLMDVVCYLLIPMVLAAWWWRNVEF